MGACTDEVRARVQAVNGAYEGVWADFLRNRFAQAGERAGALLQILGAVPDGQKDSETWIVEADFWYISGASRGNDREHLERAVACYDRALASPDGDSKSSARRMRAEALLRLHRYDEAFSAMGELATLPADFDELEVAPFRLRHDAALCERLASLGRLSLAQAGEAAGALRAVAKRVEASPLPGGRQRWPRVAQLRPEDGDELKKGLFGELLRISAPYPSERLAAWAPSSPSGGPALDPLSASVDWAQAEHEYTTGKITVIDDFFTPQALEELWRYACEEPVFRTVRNGFLGAFPADGNVHPLIMAAAESLERRMPNVLKGHPLGLWWLFKYTEVGSSGIGIHADAAAVNVNIWLTPDEARRSGGGLDIYEELPPVEAGVMEINREFATEEDEAKFRDSLLRAGGVRRVEYKQNRAAIFVSDLYHASQPFEFVNPAEQPRVNLTLLFGDRAAERASSGAAAVAAADGAAGLSAGKRPREDDGGGWDLFD